MAILHDHGGRIGRVPVLRLPAQPGPRPELGAPVTITDQHAYLDRSEPRRPGDGAGGFRHLASDSPFGPSLALQARARAGWEKFLQATVDDARTEPGSASSVAVEGAESTREDHPLLHRMVRDVANRAEGELVSVVQERHGDRVVRIARIRPVSGTTWSTAADNISPA